MPVTIPSRYFDVFEKQGRRLHLPENKIIYNENERSTTFYIVASGRVRVYVSSETGKQTTLEVLKKGRIFGDNSFLSNAYRQTTIETVTESEIIEVERGKVIDILASEKELMVLVFQHITEMTDHLTHQIYSLTNYNSTQKVADFLLNETNNGRNSIPYTHDNVASCLNLNRVTVSKIISRFENAGWMESSYGVIRIFAPDQLRELLKNTGGSR